MLSDLKGVSSMTISHPRLAKLGPGRVGGGILSVDPL